MSIIDNTKALVGPLVFKKDGSVSCGFGARTQTCAILDRENWIKLTDGIETIEAELTRLRAEVDQLADERRTAALNGQAALDEANNEILRLRAVGSGMEAALNRIGWHGLAWADARDVARAALLRRLMPIEKEYRYCPGCGTRIEVAGCCHHGDC